MKKKKKAVGNKWRMKDVDSGDRCWWWLASLFMAMMIGLIAASCDTEIPNVSIQEQGLPATLRIDVNANEPVALQTRAVNPTEIADLHVLVYNNAGDLIGQSYATTTNSSIIVKTRSASNCTIYVIANTGDPDLFSGKEITEKDLNAMKVMTTETMASWDDLITNGMHLVMIGSKTGINIAAGSPGSNTVGNFPVARLAAQVELDIKTDSTDITIKNYKVCSLPAQSYYMPNPTKTEADKNDTGNTIVGKDAAADFSKWIDGKVVAVNSSAIQATFYMYENRRGVNTGISRQENKIKANAPTNATYIVINGEAGGYTATWVIYLGANNTSNFNMKRNCNYTYTIRLKEGNVADTRVDVDEKSFPTTVGTPSNCYMVAPGNGVTIPVIRANQSPIAIAGTLTQITAATEWEAEIVWQSSPFLVYLSRSGKSGKGADGRFTVAATDAVKQGNAVVAIRNKATKDILWSWHIWITGTVGRVTYGSTTFMDRALGATSMTPGDLGTCGLFYQWGRKDPFPSIGQEGGSWAIQADDPIMVYNTFGSKISVERKAVLAIVTNNLTNAVKNPLYFYYNLKTPYDWYADGIQSTHNNNLWGGANLITPTAKTAFDPCPQGWRVPALVNNISPFHGLSATSGEHGCSFVSTTGPNFWAFGFRTYASGLINASIAGYWTASSAISQSNGLHFYSNYVQPNNTWGRANGLSIRCVPD